LVFCVCSFDLELSKKPSNINNLKLQSNKLFKFTYCIILQNVEFEPLRTSLDLLILQPRSTQIIAQKNHPLLDSLSSIMSKYLKDVNVSHLTADKVDPQFSFYTVTKANLQVYRLVKSLGLYFSF